MNSRSWWRNEFYIDIIIHVKVILLLAYQIVQVVDGEVSQLPHEIRQFRIWALRFVETFRTADDCDKHQLAIRDKFSLTPDIHPPPSRWAYCGDTMWWAEMWCCDSSNRDRWWRLWGCTNSASKRATRCSSRRTRTWWWWSSRKLCRREDLKREESGIKNRLGYVSTGWFRRSLVRCQTPWKLECSR